MSELNLSSNELERRITLGLFLAEPGQKKEPDLLDFAVRKMSEALPAFRINTLMAAQPNNAMRSTTFSERKWKRVLELSATARLEGLDLDGCGSEESSDRQPADFTLRCWSRPKREPYRKASCKWTGRWISIEVRMLQDSWRVPDKIAECMKEVALFAAKNLKLLQAQVSLAGMPNWESPRLQRYKRLPHRQLEMSTDHVVGPGWYTIVHEAILYRIIDYGQLKTRFDASILGRDESHPTHITIQIAPRITEVSSSDLQTFVDMVL